MRRNPAKEIATRSTDSNWVGNVSLNQTPKPGTLNADYKQDGEKRRLTVKPEGDSDAAWGSQRPQHPRGRGKSGIRGSGRRQRRQAQ